MSVPSNRLNAGRRPQDTISGAGNNYDVQIPGGIVTTNTNLAIGNLTIAPGAESGRGSVDKLVRVWTRSGTQEEILVHIEVQSQHDSRFPRRMYVYNHRLEDRYGRMPVSLAILGDDGLEW